MKKMRAAGEDDDGPFRVLYMSLSNGPSGFSLLSGMTKCEKISDASRFRHVEIPIILPIQPRE